MNCGDCSWSRCSCSTKQSRADAILPGELAELSNAMTSIAGVLLQLK